MGIGIVAGTEVSGTGASTFRKPSTENVDEILVASISTGSLIMTQTGLQWHDIQSVNTETDVPNI